MPLFENKGRKRYLSEKVYYSYIGYAGMVSLILFFIAFLYLLFALMCGNSRINQCDMITIVLGAGLLLVLIVFCALAQYNEKESPFFFLRNTFDKRGITWIARSTTVVFMAYTFSVLTIVLGTGGSQGSPFASVLLINATFGYALANNKSVQRAAAAAPIALYVLALIVYVDATGLKIQLAPTWYSPWVYILVALLIAAMAKAAQQKSETQTESKENPEQLDEAIGT